MLTYTSSKQKHTTGSLTHTHTHTHMNSNNYRQKATGRVTYLANGHFTGSDAHFVCEIPNASSHNFFVVADIGLAVGTPAGFAPTKECFKRSRWFGKRHKTGGTYYQSYMYPTGSAWPAFLMPCLLLLPASAWLSFPRFYCTPNKACLLCATPAGTYRLQSAGFPKIVYCLPAYIDLIHI